MTCLVVLEGGVLVDPVGVEHTHVGELGAHALLGDGPQVAHGLDLVDTVVLGLTCAPQTKNVGKYVNKLPTFQPLKN